MGEAQQIRKGVKHPIVEKDTFLSKINGPQ